MGPCLQGCEPRVLVTGCCWVLPSATAPHQAGLGSPGRGIPPAPTSCPRETLPGPTINPWAQRHHGAGRGKEPWQGPSTALEGAGWVLAWARMQQDPLLSPAANTKSIRHVPAPEAIGSGAPRARSRRWEAGDMWGAKAQSDADTLHPPLQPAPSYPALDPCPEGCGARGAPVGRAQTSPLWEWVPLLRQLRSWLPSAGNQDDSSQQHIYGAGKATAWLPVAIPGDESGTEPGSPCARARDAPPGAGTWGSGAGPGMMPWGW